MHAQKSIKDPPCPKWTRGFLQFIAKLWVIEKNVRFIKNDLV